MLDICQIFYVSRAARPYDTRCVSEILMASRGRNARLGISGCLLESGSYFGQLIEGRTDDVSSMIRRISADHRHNDFTVLMVNHFEERMFSAWPMGHLYDLEMEEALESLLLDPIPSALTIADVTARMQPDPVMGTLR